MKKRTFCLLLAVIMLVGMLPIPAVGTFAESTEKYTVRSWDDENGRVISNEIDIPQKAKKLTQDDTILEGGWYVLSSNVGFTTKVTVTGTYDEPTNIILMDGYTLSCEWGGINVPENHVLNIYGQNRDSGTIEATGDIFSAGIGGGGSFDSCGTVTIYGGTVNASSSGSGAGIGGGDGGYGGTVTVYGGSVTSEGFGGGAGIGGGANAGCGTVTVYGGTVRATGNANAAGIGGGEFGSGGTVLICGGEVIAAGSDCAAGIGGGGGMDPTIESPDFSEYCGGSSGSVTINGGTVIATGGEYGPGIGAGAGGSYDGALEIANEMTATIRVGKDFDTAVSAEKYRETRDRFVSIFICRHLDEDGNGWCEICKKFCVENYTVLSENTTELRGNVLVNVSCNVETPLVVYGDAVIYLAEKALLSAQKGIVLNAGKSLTVNAQTSSGGSICACGEPGAAGIGGAIGVSAGDLTVNGGTIQAEGGQGAAGIGGGIGKNAGTLTVNGGFVGALGGYGAVGIGGGFGGKDGKVVENGGTVIFVNGDGYVSLHDHTYSESWSFDPYYHWHDSICEHKGLTSSFAAHDFGKGTVNGNKTTYTCMCGYSKVVYGKDGDSEGEVLTDISYTGVSLSLGGDISINFYMDLTENARKNGTMTFIIGGRTVSGVSAKYNETEKEYYYSAPLTVLEMAETVTATFTYNGVDHVKEYSAVDYIEKIVGNENKYGKKTADLAKKIANFGCYAQIYLADIHENVKIGTDGYAEMSKFDNADIDVAAAKEALAVYKAEVSDSSDDLSLVGSSVNFDAATALNYYVKSESGVKPEAVCTGKTVVVTEYEDYEPEANEKVYIISVKDIAATELADDFTVTVNGELTLAGSVLAYCGSVISAHGDDSATGKDFIAVNAMTAFYEYYEAAYAYSGITVTFEMNGHGEQVNRVTGLDSGATVPKPDDPIADGWLFCGWWTDEYGKETEWDFDTDTVTKDTVLYAKWVKISKGGVYLNAGEFKDDLLSVKEYADLSEYSDIKTVDMVYLGNRLYGDRAMLSSFAQLYMVSRVQYSIVFNFNEDEAIENVWLSDGTATMISLTGKEGENTYSFRIESIQ